MGKGNVTECIHCGHMKDVADRLCPACGKEVDQRSQELDDTGSPESKLVPSPSSSSASQICGGLSIALWVGAAGFLFLDGLGGIADARFIIPGLIALLLHLISVRKKNGSMHPEQQSDNTGSTESGLVPSTLTPSAPELYRELSIVLWLCAAGILIFGGLEAIGDARFIIAVLLALFLKVVIVRKRKEKIHLQEQSDDVE